MTTLTLASVDTRVTRRVSPVLTMMKNWGLLVGVDAQ